MNFLLSCCSLRELRFRNFYLVISEYRYNYWVDLFFVWEFKRDIVKDYVKLYYYDWSMWIFGLVELIINILLFNFGMLNCRLVI